jgi:hypothetical protein
MLKKKPIIISVGCSFTDINFFSHCEDLQDSERGGWPIWTDYFKGKLEKHYGTKYEIMHFGKSGGGNDFCFNHIAQSFAKYKDRIKFVLWGGTEFERYHNPMSGFNFNPNADLRVYPKFKNMSKEYWDNCYQKMQEANVHNAVKFQTQKYGRKRIIDENLQNYWNALLLCQKYNATLLLTQLLEPVHSTSSFTYEFKRILGKPESELPIDLTCTREFEIDMAMRSPFFKDLYTHRKHFFNLRFLHIKEELEVGVNHWSAYVDRGGHAKKYQVKPWSEGSPPGRPFGKNEHIDTHPNAAGHKNIADQLWEYYETNFL